MAISISLIWTLLLCFYQKTYKYRQTVMTAFFFQNKIPVLKNVKNRHSSTP